MKRVLVVLAILPVIALAEPKYLDPRAPGAGKTCQAGYALTYTLQCDPGTRPPIDELWNQRMPGVSICTVRFTGCAPIASAIEGPNARSGYQVQDTSPDELVLVTFGLERLLGTWPPN